MLTDPKNILEGPAAGRILAAISNMPYGALVTVKNVRTEKRFTLNEPPSLDGDRLGAYLEDLARVLREYATGRAALEAELTQLKSDLSGFRRIIGREG